MAERERGESQRKREIGRARGLAGQRGAVFVDRGTGDEGLRDQLFAFAANMISRFVLFVVVCLLLVYLLLVFVV